MILENNDIISLLENYDKESKAIKQEILKQCWFMRGGLTYSEAMNLGKQEREIVNDIIKENLETTKKTKMPFF